MILIIFPLKALHQEVNIKGFDEHKSKPEYDKNEIQQIVEAAEHFESENQVFSLKYLFYNLFIILKKQLLEDKQELLVQLSNLEQENKKCLDLILKYSKGDKNILTNYDIK